MLIRVYLWPILPLLFVLWPMAAHAQGSLNITKVRAVPATCSPVNNPVIYKMPATSIDTTGGIYTCNPSTSTYAQLAPQVGSLTANTFIYANATPAVASTTSLFYPAYATNYSSASSFQPIGIDFTLAAGAGKNVATGTAYFAPIFGNIFNAAALTKTGNYLGGVIGADSITGVRATTFPKGAVLGQVTDGVTESDGSFVAYIDGDSATTTATAGLKFLYNNSTAASGFDWAVDAYGSSHDGFQAVNFKKGFARIAINAAPGTPPASSIATWADTTDARWHDKNAAGTIGTTVVADTGSSNNFLTAISSAGVITKAQPSASNLSNGVTGTVGSAVVLQTSPTITTPTIAQINFGSSNNLQYTNATGPKFTDGTTTFTVTWNLQNLSANRTVNVPNSASTTVAALTAVDSLVVNAVDGTTGVLATKTVETLLSSTASVDMNTATATTLYTSPTGRSTIVTRVVISACSTSMSTASYSYGWEAVTFANVIANATHTELTGATLYTSLSPKLGATIGTSTGTFKVLMNTLQGGAATCKMDVFGYTF